MQNKFILTTIHGNMVAIVEVAPQENRQKGEYYLSGDCVSRNVNQGTFSEVTSDGHNGRIFVLTSDLTGEEL